MMQSDEERNVTGQTPGELRLIETDGESRAAFARVLGDYPDLYRDERAFSASMTRAINKYSLGVGAFCAEFQINASTVSRWKNGQNVPHPDMRRRVLSWVRERVAAGSASATPTGPCQPERQGASSPVPGSFRGHEFADFLRWPNNEDALTDKDRDVSFSYYPDHVEVHLPGEATRFWVGNSRFELESAGGSTRWFRIVGLHPERAKEYTPGTISTL